MRLVTRIVWVLVIIKDVNNKMLWGEKLFTNPGTEYWYGKTFNTTMSTG